MAQIYLDNATTARPSLSAVSKMLPFFKERWGVFSAPHQRGQSLFPFIEEAFKSVYRLMGASEVDDVIFTSSGAEAVNHLIASVYTDITRVTGKNHFVVGQVDEAPSIMAISRLEPLGCVSRIAVANKQGVITPEAVAEAITPRTALVSLCWGNGLTGTYHPVADIASLCRERAILLHLDATHVIGKLCFDLEEIQADFISFNGSQIHAPLATGGLYIRQGKKLSPLLVGGNEQGGRRAGELNIPALVALGAAAEEAADTLDLLATEVARLRDQLEQGIVGGYPEAIVLFKESARLPHCSAIAFPGIANEALMYALDRRGVCANMGGNFFQQIGLNLIACGVDESTAHSSLSFCLSRETQEFEIKQAISIIVEEAVRLRSMSKKLID